MLGNENSIGMCLRSREGCVVRNIKGFALKHARFTILPLLYNCGQAENKTEECFVKPQKGNHVLFDEK